MKTLDQTLESFAHAEPSVDVVNAAQRKLEQVVAGAAPARVSTPRARGWLAAAASAAIAVIAGLWLQLSPTPAMAFSAVQQHFRDFSTLRFEIEQRMNGDVMMSSRISVLADGSVRAEVGPDIVVVVNTQEQRVLTLMKAQSMALVTPLDEPGTKDDALKWLQEVRDFQGVATPLKETRLIRGQRAHGWELPMEQGKLVLWANEQGLPLSMTLAEAANLELDFRFEFEPELPAELFSTEVPSGYTLAAQED